MSDPELQFVSGACDVTDFIDLEGVLDSLLFLLDIFTFVSSYQTYHRIGENQSV